MPDKCNISITEKKLIILGHACKCALKCFALKCKHPIGLTPLYWPQVGHQTLNRGNVRRSFLWSVGPQVGGESDGEGHCWTADGGRTEVFTSFQNRPSICAVLLISNTFYIKIYRQSPIFLIFQLPRNNTLTCILNQILIIEPTQIFV